MRDYLPKLALLIGLLFCLQTPSVTLATDPPKYDSPAAVITAAEDAFIKRDFKAFADCLDSTGQKKMNVTTVQLFTALANMTPDGNGKKAKEMLAKYGVSDLSKQGDESDEHFAERLAGQLKDPAGFMAESMPLANTDSFDKNLPKGTLKSLKIEGTKAKATYDIVVTPKYTLSQDMAFVQTSGSWKIASEMYFPSPMEMNNR